MQRVRTLAMLVLLPMFAVGCATSSGGGLSNEAKCAVIGAAVGAGAGVLVNGEVVGGVVGAAAGAVLSGLFCNDMGMKVADSDGDGVPDDKDKCPGTPQGAKVNEFGCIPDSDGDGVTDDRDQCPDTPAGTAVDSKGCPADSDGDGVTDDKDQCPDTPKGWKVNSRGCPIPIVFRDVHFAFDSAKLSAEAMKTLDTVAVKSLQDNPAVRIRILGHTDSVGTEAYNQKLSERRANSVKDYLATKGIAAVRMEAEGRGETDPVAPNSTADGRSMNRRVEIYAVK